MAVVAVDDLTVDELADQLDVYRHFVHDHVHADHWPHHTDGRRILFSPDDARVIAALLDEPPDPARGKQVATAWRRLQQDRAFTARTRERRARMPELERRRQLLERELGAVLAEMRRLDREDWEPDTGHRLSGITVDLDPARLS